MVMYGGPDDDKTRRLELEELLGIHGQPSLLAEQFLKSNGLFELFIRLIAEKNATWEEGKFNYNLRHCEFKDIIQNEVQDFTHWTKLAQFVLHNGEPVTSGTLNKSYSKPTK